MSVAPVLLVDVENRQSEQEIDVERWQELAAAALGAEGVGPPAEMSLTFVDEATIARLNQDHLGGTGPTDVLAFPIDPAEVDRTGPIRLIGDVVICPSFAADGAARGGTSLADELALLVVHGVLHLLGHDHADPDERALMRAREQDLLARFHHP